MGLSSNKLLRTQTVMKSTKCARAPLQRRASTRTSASASASASVFKLKHTHESNSDTDSQIEPAQSQEQPQIDRSASRKLREDAAREEAAEAGAGAAARTHPLVARAIAEAAGENWAGEERMRDAVLRMLVDKHRPLRGPARSADEKLRAAPPAVFASGSGDYAPDWRGRKGAPLLPAVEGHRPWLVTYKAPSHAVARVKLGNIASGAGAGAGKRREDAERKAEPAARRRGEAAERLGRARESTLDYRLGLRGDAGAGAEGVQRRPMPVGMKGWASLIEERIERARQEGHFRTLKGRGKPLVRETAESNPFIAREEFLMNRIVQKNNAAPPWVELQTELEAAVSSFRAVLAESWTRRAVRMLTLNRRAAALRTLTVADAGALRDAEWEAREAAYQDAAVAEVNSLVRRYNGVAPYAVRRPLHSRDKELERAYRESAEGIVEGVRERLKDGALEAGGAAGGYGDEEGMNAGSRDGGSEDKLKINGRVGLWDVVRGWLSGSR